jgi:hypothetical protein
MEKTMARPFEIDREDLRVKMLEYLDSDGYKTITAFCVKYRISRRYLYKLFEDHEELKHIGEQITLTREQALEVGGLSGELNAGMAKFALNQLGWSEKQEVKQESINVSINQGDADAMT